MVQVFGGEPAGQRAAPDHAEREPGPFFVREGDNLDGIFGLDTFFLHRVQDLDTSQHATRPVEVPTLVYRIDVRADEDGGSLRVLSLAAAEEVPRGVLAHRESSLFHVAGDPVFGGPLFIGER